MSGLDTRTYPSCRKQTVSCSIEGFSPGLGGWGSGKRGGVGRGGVGPTSIFGWEREGDRGSILGSQGGPLSPGVRVIRVTPTGCPGGGEKGETGGGGGGEPLLLRKKGGSPGGGGNGKIQVGVSKRLFRFPGHDL